MSLVTLDGNNYDWKHGSYQHSYARLHNSRPTANGGHARWDYGPWKRTFNVTLLADNNNVVGGAKAIRNNLRTTFAKTTPIGFITPDGDSFSVYFYDALVERFRFDIDISAGQTLGFEYEMDITLIEA